MRVLIWATTLQADILALCLHLQDSETVELMIVSPGLGALAKEPIGRISPLHAPALDREDPGVEESVRAFGPQVVVFDNHLPPFRIEAAWCSMWHGLGWKARPQADVRTFRRRIRKTTGIDPIEPNPRFMAQCYHRRDKAWRVEQWGLHPSNCVVTGMCFTDLLRAPPYGREDLAGRYNFDVTAAKTVLVNFTWHYGGIFPGAKPGPETEARELRLLHDLLEVAESRSANMLFCMHDRNRYPAEFAGRIEAVAADSSSIHVKYKDQQPDNLADLLVADVMVSNLSSFITFAYHLRRPTVHLCPSPSLSPGIEFAALKKRPLRLPWRDKGPVYMNEPEDNGGITAYTAQDVIEGVQRGLDDPHCCEERAQTWIDGHVSTPDGRSAARLAAALEERFSA